MILINKTTGAEIGEIITNHSITVDEALQILAWTVDEDGEVFTEDEQPVGAYLEEIEMVY